jgi:hypothetical protein
MMFWFKKKKIVIDCFTPYKGVHDLYKIDKAVTFFPEEVKKLSNFYKKKEPNTKISYDAATIRKCIGLQELYKTGFILPMWTDFICEPAGAVQGNNAIGLMLSPFSFSQHDKEQFTGFFEGLIHVKLSSPWKMVDKSGTKFSWNSTTWNLHNHVKNFTVVPGVISFEHQADTNVNVFMNPDVKNFTLTAGTPLVHMTPLTDNEIVLKHHLVSVNEFYDIGIPSDFSMLTPERYIKWKRESERAKCPFGFGK